MNKLKLRLDSLAVETFDTTRVEREKGTVVGEQQCTCQTVCTCPGCYTCAATCPQTCDDNTCANSCYGTCGYSCFDTCTPPCPDIRG